MQEFHNLLLIAGTVRNTGKTTLACEIINKISQQTDVIGIKISPHFHGGTNSLTVLSRSEKFNLYQETSVKSSKDSSKMLSAGSDKVCYAEVNDKYIFNNFTKMSGHIP